MVQNRNQKNRVPRKGDIYRLNDTNTVGKEIQSDPRYVLVISPDDFNRHNPSLCLPITQGGNFARLAGFAAPLNGAGTQTQGAAIASQVRVYDLVERGAVFIEEAPGFVVEDAVMRLVGLLEG